MILYNITFKVEESIASNWLTFMKDDYLPLINKTGFVSQYKILRLLNEEYSEGGITYSVQLFLNSLDHLTTYKSLYEESMEENLHKRFGGKFVFFKTWLEEIC